MAEKIKIYDKIVYKKLDDLIPYDNNARYNERAVKALENDIPVMGFNVPIVIDRNNVIVKGHSRYEALKKLGYDAAPCIVIDGDEKQVAEERLVDNKVSELSTWDADKLNNELREMNINLREMQIDVPAVRSGVDELMPVNESEVNGAERKILVDDIMQRGHKRMIEVHCENCGETFFVDEAEVERFAE